MEERPRRTHADGALLTGAMERPTTPLVIMSGWACRARQLADGRRQILELLGPGDIVGLSPWQPPHAVMALTTIRTVEAPELRSAFAQPRAGARLDTALQAIAAETEAFLSNQVVRLGRQTAYERMAHFFVDMERKLKPRGLVLEEGYNLPLTQEMIADTLGLSVVHVNRTLQQMRREGVLSFIKGRVQIRDRNLLEATAESQPRPSPAPTRPRNRDDTESGSPASF